MKKVSLVSLEDQDLLVKPVKMDVMADQDDGVLLAKRVTLVHLDTLDFKELMVKTVHRDNRDAEVLMLSVIPEHLE